MAFSKPFRTLALLVAAASGGAVLPAGCGNGSTACVPGQSVSCVGNVSCANAFQVCKADGSGYGECSCGGDAGPSIFPRTGPNSGLIGAACGSSSDCRRGLDCIAKDAQFLAGEGPSGGLCLSRCVPGTSICQAYDANAKCVVLDNNGTPSDPSDDIAYCLPGCKIGDTKTPDRCRSRPDLVCAESPTGSGVGYCRPACRDDTDCKPRFCDLATGLCSDTAKTGDPIGAACDPNNSACAGGCVPHLANYAECSGVCSYFEPGACGQTRTSPPYDFFCYTDAAIGSGPGDLGYCARACNCDGDCARPDAVCEPTPDIAAKTGRTGMCGSKLLPSGTPRKNLPCSM